MRICPEHWEKLKQAIKDRGIYHLVNKTSEGALENIQNQLRGTPTDYDPLIDCNWMISSVAINQGGLYLLSLKEDGTHYCPICEAEAKGVPTDSWIDGPANSVLKYCQENGLVSKYVNKQ